MIEPVKRLNVTDSIVSQIKALILEGKLNPGDRLPPERELMHDFQVGRTSLRESLKVLEAQGLIKKTQKGTIISDNHHKFFTDSLMFQLYFSSAEWNDIFETRRFIEKELAVLAALRATEENLSSIEETILDMKSAIEANDEKEYVASNIRFHETIAKSSQNRVLHNLFKSIDNLVSISQVKAVNAPGIMNESLRFHEDIYQAIKARDAELAGNLMVEHIESVHGFLENRLSQEEQS